MQAVTSVTRGSSLPALFLVGITWELRPVAHTTGNSETEAPKRVKAGIYHGIGQLPHPGKIPGFYP